MGEPLNETSSVTSGVEPLPAPTAVRQELEQLFDECELVRPFRRASHDPGQRISYDITGVTPANVGRMVVDVERAVGGGFAGQVYRVRLVSVDADDGPIEGLEVGQRYALKLLTPPSTFSRLFRNALFKLAYQGHFAAQVNPASVRVGVLWQTLIRRAARIRFGRDDAVCRSYATLYDHELHAHGEINEWIQGRVWKFEVDDQLFTRWKFEGGPPADHNAPEYVHKKLFMRHLVEVLHEMGAPELARQYEWWSLKSQPNVLKRVSKAEGEPSPSDGLTAVDFRAGLALLPYLPMSPVDVRLILGGLLRGRIVQFDRSVPEKLDAFIESHKEDFSDLEPAIEELREVEAIHRASLPDVTHHHVRLLFDSRLRRSVKEGVITAWKHLGRVDDAHAEQLSKSSFLFLVMALLSLVPLLGRRLVKLWGDNQTRQHLRHGLSSLGYLLRWIRGARIEALVRWHRAGRVNDARARALTRRPVRFWAHRLCFGWLPAKLHRFFTEWSYAWGRMRSAVSFAFNFLRVPSFREDWLLEQVELGHTEGMLTDTEAAKVKRDIKDPYIQKYLRCLAVHVCTVPVTQVTMVVVGAVATLYFYFSQGMTWVESVAVGSATGAIVQLLPISPGSIARGVFVLFLMVKERDIRNYYIAAPVAFIHAVGYLAFPLQMVTHNPGLARFMAGRWATSLVRHIPVFGERGGLVEHIVFDFFFNLPLSIKRSFKQRPLPWSVATAMLLAATAAITVGGYAHLWEWRQPQVRVEAATVSSLEPFYSSGGDLHWGTRGVRVHLEGAEEAPSGPVDFHTKHWDESVGVGDEVDVVIRRSFFGDEWDGLAISRRGGSSQTRRE